MTDVRLTATNPTDSSVVPVACNSRGELLIEEVNIEAIDNDLSISGNLQTRMPSDYWSKDQTYIGLSDGDGQPVGSLDRFLGWNTCLTANGYRSNDGTWHSFECDDNVSALQIELDPRSPVINFRITGNKPTGTTIAIDRRFYIDYAGGHAENFFLHRGGLERSEENVIDVGAELEFLKAQVRALMEKLRMAPEGGWEVWDGSSET